MSRSDPEEAAIRFAHPFATVAGARLALRHVLGSRDAAPRGEPSSLDGRRAGIRSAAT